MVSKRALRIIHHSISFVFKNKLDSLLQLYFARVHVLDPLRTTNKQSKGGIRQISYLVQNY